MTTRSRRLAAASVLAVALVASGTPARAFLKIGTRIGTSTVGLAWKSRPVRYFVSDSSVPGVSVEQFRDAIGRAAATWQAAPTSGIAFEFVGVSSARPLDEDGASTFGFLSRPQLDRVLASTSFLVDTTTGEILESDVFFNSAFPWSVANGGEAGRYDLESIAAHELGHVLGLGHSALGETELVGGGGRRLVAAGALMFPIAYGAGTTLGRTLQPDDVAGASDLYPDGGFRQVTGSIQGRVRMGGSAVYGAHVVAFDLRSSRLVGGFSLDDGGGFVIAGLSPGVYLVRAEPLDDGDVESFLDASAEVEDGFRAAFHPELVVVPANGTAPSFDLEVQPK
jgi:hypothetical protein